MVPANLVFKGLMVSARLVNNLDIFATKNN